MRKLPDMSSSGNSENKYKLSWLLYSTIELNVISSGIIVKVLPNVSSSGYYTVNYQIRAVGTVTIVQDISSSFN
jgi:hypothetical protein